MNFRAYEGDRFVSLVVCPWKLRNDPVVHDQLERVLRARVRLVPHWRLLDQTAYQVLAPGCGGYLPPLKWIYRRIVHRGRPWNKDYRCDWMFGVRGYAGAGLIGGFTIYLAWNCHFGHVKGDWNTRKLYIGITRNANEAPLTAW